MDIKVPSEIKNPNDLRKGLEFVLRWEGGYVNDKDDPGGETKWGISKRSFPDLDIKNLTPEQALSIYVTRYWEAAGCDKLSFPLNVVVFDTAVNCGVSRAKSWLVKSQENLAQLSHTLPKEHQDRQLLQHYFHLRQQHYMDLVNSKPTLRKFLKGWLNRLSDLRKFVDYT